MSTQQLRSAILFGFAVLAAGCGGGGGGGGDGDGGSVPPTSTNTAPKISGLVTSQSIDQDESSDLLSFTVSDAEHSVGDITLKAEWSSPVIGADGVQIGGNGANRVLIISPEQGVSGNAVVTVTATDSAGASSSASVNVTVGSRQRSFTEMVGTSYAKSADDDAEVVSGYSWADDPSEDDTAFDHLME